MIREMYAEIQKQTDKHSVSELCEIYGVSRSGYYKWLKRAGQLNRYEKTHKILDSYVLDIHSHHPMMGYRQIRETLAELNENLRQIYVEAYTLPENLEIIHRMTAEMLHRIFGAYMPGYSVSDFYESDIGSAAIMRGYMARPCDVYFTLERKLERFLQLTLRIYCVPEEKQREVMTLIASLDIRAIANEVMQKLFAALEMHYEFTLGEEAKQI